MGDLGQTAPLHPGPLGGALGALVSRVYAAAIARRNRRFDAGKGVVTLDRPVVSVGNLSVGGTGKTPMVREIVRMLQAAGRRPCIAMRGYRSRAGVSDEAEEYRAALPGVPLVVRPDRVEALLDFFATDAGAEVDCVVLDDGFQHRRLARQLDIVLIDATRSAFKDRLLPAGWLREPVDSLKRAHAVVLTHAETATAHELDAIRTAAGAINPSLLITTARHEWTGLAILENAAERTEPVTWLRGRRAFTCCAIGNPEPFLAAVAAASGAPLVGSLVLRDHDPFEVPTIRRLLESAAAANATAIVVTEKDWTKLKGVKPAAWPCAVARPRLTMRIDAAPQLESCIAGSIAGFSEAT